MIIAPPLNNYFLLFGFNIHYYSLCMACAIFLGWIYLFLISKNKRFEIEFDSIVDFSFYLILFSILGARIYYVILSFDYYLKHPLEVFMIWKGGISIHGAILGGIIFGLFFSKRYKLSFLKLADFYVPALALGQFIGRWGNFFNSEAFGLPVSGGAPIMLYVPFYLRPLEYKNFDYFHPAFLYESLLDFLMFFILFFIYKKTAPKRSGITFFTYILLYSLIRLFLEPIRLDTVFYLSGIPFPVIVSVLGFLTGIFGLVSRIRRTI